MSESLEQPSPLINVQAFASDNTATPPPDAQAMTREQVETTIARFLSWHSCEPECDHDLTQVLSTDAAKRETIRRLEGQRDELNKLCTAHERIEADLMEQVAQLQARLTASEAREKECQQTYLRIIEALEVLNDRPEVKPLASWDKIAWLIDKLKSSETGA